MKLWTSGRQSCPVGVRLDSADASTGPRNSRVCPQIRRQVLHLPHHSAGAEQERLHVQALGYRMPPDEMDGTKPAPKDHRAGQGHQVQPHQLLCVALAGQRHGRQERSPKPGVTSALLPQRHVAVHLLPASIWTRRRCSLPEPCLTPASPTSATTSCTRTEATAWSRDSAFTRRPRQQQLLRQGRRDSHAGGRRNAGSHVLQPLPRSRLHAHQYRSHQLLARSASGGRGRGLHLGLELLQEHLCRLRQSHQWT